VRVFILITFLTQAFALQSQIWLSETQLDTLVVAEGLEIPWDMQRWGEDTIIFTERGGDIKRLAVNSGVIDTLFNSSDVAAEGQAGLMGLQLHPDFPNDPFAYVAMCYYVGSNIKLRIDRLTYNSTTDSLEFDESIVSNIPSSNSNTGGRIMIDEDEFLWLTVGDIKNNDLAQDESSLNGKILRYNIDGSIPSTNPTSGSAVYSFGHRNPQGLAQTETGSILISEHGPSSNDELNKIESGGNYGWPHVSGFCNSGTQSICDSLNVVEPLETWSPTIAPAGIEFSAGSEVPEWDNCLLVASLKEKRLFVSQLNTQEDAVTNTSWILAGDFGRVRDVLIMDGKIYLCTSNRDALGFPSNRDDLIVQLSPSKHTGVQEPNREELTAFVQDNTIRLSKPVNTQVSVSDPLGRIIIQSTLNNEDRIQLPSPTSGLYIVSFLDHYAPIKLIKR
jgi:aldose sugar dehydrogenase